MIVEVENGLIQRGASSSARLLLGLLCMLAAFPAALPAAAGAIVVDHRCTDLTAVPHAAIAQAKATLRIG